MFGFSFSCGAQRRIRINPVTELIEERRVRRDRWGSGSGTAIDSLLEIAAIETLFALVGHHGPGFGLKFSKPLQAFVWAECQELLASSSVCGIHIENIIFLL